ncbi:Adenosylcobinamide kinase / Adenosylcobinamide-phosphate guanylyltransferase [hydrothermal vent metagenome]|uniref:Adenosylcobinamide kinase n=1 Tax=hydrothermal vent metagenome TaxID=652676 RepID=A0A3B0TD32_9ZZZZ
MNIKEGRPWLIIGGARSGKSALGERLAVASGLSLHYVATALPGDEEMAARIAAHRARRGAGWTTHGAATGICGTLDNHGGAGTVMVIDCLTLWLSNLMEAGCDLETETGMLVEALGRAQGVVILISGEVGGGIVPGNALGRAFRDAHGLLNQRIALAADTVVLVTAGLPQVLKSNGRPVHG